jgi:spore coat polysaccharide biosynthesis protein SpsF
MSKVMAIVQARMGSTRLPGKVLAEVAGRPMLAHVLERVGCARRLDGVILAVTTAPADAPLLEQAAEWRALAFAGSEEDVLDRFYQAALAHGAEVIVRVTSDCPLIEPAVIDRVTEVFLQGGFDYVCNTQPPTFPDGLDTEVFSCEVLSQTWHEAHWASEREHVTPYIWKHPEIFRLYTVRHEPDLSSLRWTVDTVEDLAFVRAVYDHLYRPGDIFGLDEVLTLLERKPALLELNAAQIRNEGYVKSLREDQIVYQQTDELGS